MKNQILKRRFFVVIHTLTGKAGLDHALDQTSIAKECGADGVFLIPDYEKGTHAKARDLDQFFYVEKLQKEFPDFLIGVNFLKKLHEVTPGVYDLKPQMIQTDGSSLSGINKMQLPETEFFCGVAFKYSPNEKLRGPDLRRHCLDVSKFAEVPTTSGERTGKAADIEKIREIRLYLPADKRLGIASGVTVENVKSYLELGVTDFLVATWLIKDIDMQGFDLLDPDKIKRMAQIIHSYNN